MNLLVWERSWRKCGRFTREGGRQGEEKVEIEELTKERHVGREKDMKRKKEKKVIGFSAMMLDHKKHCNLPEVCWAASARPAHALNPTFHWISRKRGRMSNDVEIDKFIHALKVR